MKATIPPPVVLLICGALMWLTDRLLPLFNFVLPYNTILFWIIFLSGLSLLTSGVVTMFRRKTVIHPDKKSLLKATALVTTGVFRFTRNPIYLGMAIMLVAWVIFLENWLSIIGILVFVTFINRNQIKPEEEALERIFGAEYNRYKRDVRRWI